ncbi:MAG: hypothetical protein ACD_62C00002G0008 [uncultured bacterium]|nr:MAG: hypothetical protein ACD_62C00002G0008 [uncultured bacterium]
MSKTMHFIYLCLFVIFFVGFGFVAMKQADLSKKYYSYLSTDEPTTNQPGTSNAQLETLNKKLTEQQQEISSLNDKITELTQSGLADLSDKYMPAPEFATKEPVFSIREESKQTFKVTGFTKPLADWQQRNELFFEYVLQKIIPFEYDRRTQSIAVLDVMENSVFYQMGLRKGDRILRVNGQPFIKGMDLRYKLIEPKNKKIQIMRDKQNILLDVAYQTTADNPA